jgi:DNA repair exonuclease SbcCD ATPase subunit
MEEVVLKVKVEGSGDSEAKVKSIKQQLREAKEAALQAKEGTEEYFRALQKAAGLADQLKDVNEAVNTLNPGEKAAAFGTLINTVAGGFQTITGLYGLLGEKSEDVEKMLLRVQAASALAMGVQSLVEAQKQWKNLSAAIQQTTIFQQLNTAATSVASTVQSIFTGTVNATTLSFKALRIAIALTGIGLIALGLAALVMNWKKVNEAIDKGVEYIKKYKLAFASFALVLAPIIIPLLAVAGAIKLINRAMGDGESTAGDYEKRIKLLNEALNKLIETELKRRNALAGGANDIERQIKLLQAQGKTASETASLEDKLFRIRLKNIDDEILARKKYAQDVTDLEQQRKDLVNDDYARQASLSKTLADKKIKDAKEAADKLSKSEEDITNLTKDELLKRQEAAKKEADEYRDLLRVKRDEAWATEDATTLKIKEELQKRRDAERAADDERSAAEQQAFEDRKERIEAGFQLAQAAANSLNTLNNIITENEKRGLKEGEVLSVETQKKAFKRAQGLALIQTTINGAQAISSILGQYPKFDGGFAMVAALVSATAAIASQYAVIASQKFNPEGGGGSGSPSAPMGMNGGGGFNAPSIQPPSNTSGLIQEGENFKVYVVESDITNSQMGVQQNKKKALITI